MIKRATEGCDERSESRGYFLEAPPGPNIYHYESP
jgi:hypothetical protein